MGTWNERGDGDKSSSRGFYRSDGGIVVTVVDALSCGVIDLAEVGLSQEEDAGEEEEQDEEADDDVGCGHGRLLELL
jgi:hypothetical protein